MVNADVRHAGRRRGRRLAIAGVLVATLGVSMFGCSKEKGVEGAQEAAAAARADLFSAISDAGDAFGTPTTEGQWYLCSAGPVKQVKYGARATYAVEPGQAETVTRELADAWVDAGWEITASGDGLDAYRDLKKDDVVLQMGASKLDSQIVTASVTTKCISVGDDDTAQFDFTEPEPIQP